jgi:predicted metal-binding membrane protein
VTSTVGALPRPEMSATTITLLALDAAAWIGTVIWAASMDMHLEAGTMGLGLAGFVGMWTLMMAAMMLPAVSPLVSLYAKSVRAAPGPLTAFGAGYLLTWAATGLVAFGLSSLFDALAENHPAVSHGVAVGAFAACGVYQLTPMKRWCLRHCRSPIGHLMRYASYRGPTRHLRAGAHHGLLCVGCCWTLMLVLIAVGVMNIPVMIGLALLVTLEKQWKYGETLANVAGVAALIFALAIVFDASLAPGLIDRDGDTDMMMSMS